MHLALTLFAASYVNLNYFRNAGRSHVCHSNWTKRNLDCFEFHNDDSMHICSFRCRRHNCRFNGSVITISDYTIASKIIGKNNRKKSTPHDSFFTVAATSQSCRRSLNAFFCFTYFFSDVQNDISLQSDKRKESTGHTKYGRRAEAKELKRK